MNELTFEQLSQVAGGIHEYEVDYTFYITSFDYLTLESAFVRYENKTITIDQLMEIVLPYVRPTNCNSISNCITVHVSHEFT